MNQALNKNAFGEYVSEPPPGSCPKCECIHCITRATNKAFGVEEAPLPLGAVKEVAALLDMGEPDFTAITLQSWAPKFVRPCAEVGGNIRVWYLPHVRAWADRNADLIHTRKNRLEKIQKEASAAQSALSALSKQRIALGEKALPCPECMEMIPKSLFPDHVATAHGY